MPEVIDPQLKSLIEAHSAALAVLLAKIASGEPALPEEISKVTATDADLKSAICAPPAPETPEAPAAA